MRLDKFYSLRKNFTLIGLTGRAGSGCSAIAKDLTKNNFLTEHQFKVNEYSTVAEEIKFNICLKFLSYQGNWSEFKVINYKDVLLLHVFFEAFQTRNYINGVVDILCNNGENDKFLNRFCKKRDADFVDKVKEWLEVKSELLENHFEISELNFNEWLESKKDIDFIRFYFDEFVPFADDFHELLNNYSITKRSRFNHDVAISLRAFGKTNGDILVTTNNHENIYIVAESINRLVKFWRKRNNNKARIVIDSLKNSLELMYFKEKFGAFYMIAINKDKAERKKYVEDKLIKKVEEKFGESGDAPDKKRYDSEEAEIKEHAEGLLTLDDYEVKGKQVNSGEFSSPDVENCIQKSDYHIYHTENVDYSISDSYKLSSRYQLIKLIALINQPGIITPTAIERTMQVAYNAKFNSGCISRQVGAVITDKDFIVKSIGWNDVAKGQMPCKLRDLKNLIKDKPTGVFSEYEIKGVVENSITKVKATFNELAKREFENSNQKDLEGKPCSFCFKTFQNAFERKDNQVHTRSLHAEENAMMQISKKGGIGLEGGKLFTTASPCELCSKKAFQLGVTEIFYIDPYPGIAMEHTLKNGILDEKRESKLNPKMTMFRGAVGRAFHKLYEPFMAYKDEVSILTNLNPKSNLTKNQELIDHLTISNEKKIKILKIIEEE